MHTARGLGVKLVGLLEDLENRVDVVLILQTGERFAHPGFIVATLFLIDGYAVLSTIVVEHCTGPYQGYEHLETVSPSLLSTLHGGTWASVIKHRYLSMLFSLFGVIARLVAQLMLSTIETT